MLARVPQRMRTRGVLEAATSPSALLLAGAGASAVILAGLPIAAAAVAAGVGWAARVALAVPRGRPGDRVSPNQVSEPWRRFVVDAQQAKARFDRTVRQTQDGPLKERLTAIGGRIGDGVQECWRIARQGDVLQGALKELNIQNVENELSLCNDELRNAPEARRVALTRTRDALVAQRQSYQRLRAVWDDARNRLEVLNAELDEAVARAVELSVHTGDLDALNPLGESVDTLVDELESLRLGLEEAGGTAQTAS